MAADPLESVSRVGSGPLTTPVQPDARLLALADQCVMCGLCLPHCPTYRISLDEAESPRGRIALARWIAGGELAAGPGAPPHPHQCPARPSCGKGCPSGGRFGGIITPTPPVVGGGPPPARPRGPTAP